MSRRNVELTPDAHETLLTSPRQTGDVDPDTMQFEGRNNTITGRTKANAGQANVTGGIPKKRIFRGKTEVEGYSYPRRFSSDEGFRVELFVRTAEGEQMAYTILAENLSGNIPQISIYNGKISTDSLLARYRNGQSIACIDTMDNSNTGSCSEMVPLDSSEKDSSNWKGGNF